MRTFWLRLALLVIATIVIHDVYMATTGHALAAGTTSVEQHGGPHRHHQAPGAPEHRQTNPAGASAHCDPLRVAAPLNRDMSPSLDSAPVALHPEPSSLMVFASTSRTFVETPLPHPPDLNRAFFQVYLI